MNTKSPAPVRSGAQVRVIGPAVPGRAYGLNFFRRRIAAPQSQWAQKRIESELTYPLTHTQAGPG
jgi:hypothetical protein